MWELLIRSRKFIAGSIVFGVFVIMGIIGPLVLPDPQKFWLFPKALPPLTPGHPLGTTSWGQDVLSQLCTGIRNSLYVGVLSGGLGTLIAVLLGALGAYKGGLADEASNFVTNVVMVFPVVPALLIMASIVGREGRTLFLVAVLIALTSWPWAARCIRSQVLSLKEREFINLARMSGMRSSEIVIKEVLPNMLAYIIMVFVLLAGGGMLAETGMSLLGVGPNPESIVTLGSMIYNCRLYAQVAEWVGTWVDVWWWYIPPGIVLTVLLSAIFIIHAGMDEVFNPRLRRV